MKYTAFIFALLWSSTCLAVEVKETYLTTAKLPNDHTIWPVPKLDITKDTVVVTAKFVEAKKILSLVQGNYWRITYFVKYEVTKSHKGYPHKEITFIVNDDEPTKESGIRVKRVALPFREGFKTIFMAKDKRCEHMDYFNIISYQQANQ
ncbi:MAG: hypothetical protein ABW146_04065 [Candidatus Sedimenticola sp. 6PFRAG7]